MRSPLSFGASIVFLATLPAAVAGEALFGVDAELTVHLGLGLGCALVGIVDFKTPNWAMIVGVSAAYGLTVTFALQALAQITGSGKLRWLAFDILGQWPESFLISLLVVWLVSVLTTDSRGWTRFVGWLLVPSGFAAIVLNIVFPIFGQPPPAAIKLLLLVPFIWLLLESRKSATASTGEFLDR